MTLAESASSAKATHSSGSSLGTFIDRAFWVLVVVALPTSVVAHFLAWDPLVVFGCAVLSLLPLARFMGNVTEELAATVGPLVGGLLNATFGNAAELIIALMALRAGLIDVVKATIAGSIISNLLLVAGLAMFLGGLRFKEQTFQPLIARVNASTMNLAVVALMLPTLVAATTPTLGELSIQELSTAVAVVLIGVYGLSLLFSLKTHSYLYGIDEDEIQLHEDPEPVEPNPVLDARGSIPQKLKIQEGVGSWVWVLVLIGLAALVAVESEFLVGSIEVVVEDLGITPLFLGVILLPILGNAAEHGTAVTVALKNKMDLSLSVALGSTLQIALFVGPVLVLVGDVIHQPMDFQFRVMELVAVGVAVLLVNSVSSDGRSNWLEGLLLLATYTILAISFFFLP
ncbi:MAG: calcium/proton exchanger [Synechococcaceae cyanobacterium RM1_1_27]|nr:calcium/proton exchanger [Synechococcaceae cyanobacterium SM2_3_2]NJO86369.1 calcium/proton exchanger [Synechococcaceae cyanobacterium RM1_1_27]